MKLGSIAAQLLIIFIDPAISSFLRLEDLRQFGPVLGNPEHPPFLARPIELLYILHCCYLLL